ncbi:MAG: hydroxyethylthiazole kinase [Rhodocyclaceae bacterium]|nr:hydroxyethylthiazole kinase [Rhodocyclaceae bacterium]MBX3667926.1 hydroxyethylthiazole kinase [Rhodocyclaceae bacterium]
MNATELSKIRAEGPLIHNITNYVVMNTTANALLALGASPVMAHAVDEVEAMAGLARALVINIGTLSAAWVDAMHKAARVASERGIPVVLDPVGCGATAYRTDTALSLIRTARPTLIRGNASEIRALVRSGSATKGVDSVHTPDQVRDDAVALSRSLGCTLSISGPVDLIVGGDRVASVANGHPMMARVTGMGCTASAVSGAFLAVSDSPFDAAVEAMATVGIAGELAAEIAHGPGSFQMHFLDALARLEDSDIARRRKVAAA